MKLSFGIPLIGLLFAGACCMAQDLTVTVQNTLAFPRTEIVAIQRRQLSKFLKQHPEKDLRIKKQGTATPVTTQWIDYDQDGLSDELLFLADVTPSSVSDYNIIADTAAVPETPISTYSRFVPERADDYAWENDKVAFRVYGPKGQKEALQGVAGSTLSSGIDLWLKRVSYPIINKWYREHLQSPGYYHTDHGEGYDPYQVGNSRGTGGIGVWVNDSLQVSQNYTSYKTIATGPLRTVFELSYAPWSSYGIMQISRISLDLGSNFSKSETSLTAAKKAPNYTIGITLHTNKGETAANKTRGWFRHWEPIDDSYVGEGIVTDPSIVTSAFANVSKTPDQSNLLVVAKPLKKLVYYAGFAWQKSGQVNSKADWDAMLEKQAQIIAHPLKATVRENKKTDNTINIKKQLEYCALQAAKTVQQIPDNGTLPRSIPTAGKEWKMVDYKDWTSGFWPGELWYLYEVTGDNKWKIQADKFSRYLTPLSVSKAGDHDLGFQVFSSFGNGYRLTKNPEYKTIILKTADTLATLFNPKVGTILSWPHYGGGKQHNTIIDNMMNLELLFWAAKNGGSHKLYDIAVKHAETTMANHFRPDYSAYHVVLYDKDTGSKIKGITAQGYSDSSMWARGQAWAIYGFTMVYRETKDPKFLEFAQKVARPYLDRLPADLIPYWDFNAPGIPNEPRDASAAAITASALIELSGFTKDTTLKKEYLQKARSMLAELSAHYLSNDTNSAFLLHATGHKPAGSEIDCSINYADYYYLEAIMRMKK